MASPKVKYEILDLCKEYSRDNQRNKFDKYVYAFITFRSVFMQLYL